MKPGIYPDIPHETYHAGDEISKSGLDLMAVSPAHYVQGLSRTQALFFGGAYDTAVLEPDEFARRYYPDPDFRWAKTIEKEAAVDVFLSVVDDTVDGPLPEVLLAMKKADFLTAFEHYTGRELIGRKDWDTIQAMADVIRNHPTAGAWIDDAKPQMSAYAEDPETGVACRSRADLFDEERRIITDLKTCGFRMTPWKLRAECRKYRYPVQDAFYRDVFGWAGCPIAEFRFVMQEKAAPYAVRCFHFWDEAVDHARRLYREDLNLYAICREQNVWPAYPNGDEEINPYPWLNDEAEDLTSLDLEVTDETDNRDDA